jgi:hypothetical protein
MGGVTVAPVGATNEDVIAEVNNYIVNTFDDMKFAPQNIEDLLISAWPIEEDDDYNEWYPTTIATHY